MIRSVGKTERHNFHNSIAVAALICLILVFPLVLGANNTTSDQPVLVQYENGTVTAEWAVDFLASPLEGYPPLCVSFDVQGPLGEYAWDFGDGTTSNVRNPVHCYLRPGSYWVSLKYYVGQIKGEVKKENYILVKDLMTFVDYTAEPSVGPAPLLVQFKLIGTPTSVLWQFDDGEESKEMNPVHQYAYPGGYTPTLTYCMGSACEKISKFNYIEVTEGADVDIVADRRDGIAPFSTRFNVTSPVDTCSWEFGDGAVSYEKRPAHFYTEPGVYDVSLTYSINGSEYDIYRPEYIIARSRETPDINASPRSGIAPLCVTFDLIRKPESWIWNFGDNLTAGDERATHCYGFNGSYDVSLNYCYNGLCNNVTRPGFITVAAPQIFTERGDDDGTVKFSTDAKDGLTYLWNFGDFLSSEDVAPVHRYEQPDTYPVSLSVLGICGCVVTVKTNVTVNPKNPLDFTATPLSGCAPHCVQFSEQSPEVPKSRIWDFGDGETSDEKNPFHCYQFAGRYTVGLINEYPDREENKSREDYITVYAVPRPSLSAFPLSGTAPLTVAFTDTTAGPETKRYWDFGDGVTGTGDRMEHEFTEPGVYNVTLSVWGQGDCHGTVSQQIHVLKPEEIRFDLSGLPRRGIAPVCTSYGITGNPHQVKIDFGDGETSEEKNPFHCYENAGIYSPGLHACDVSECYDTVNEEYVVVIPPYYGNLSLYAGWNLVSVPVSLQPGEDTAAIFAGVNTGGHSLYSWDGPAGTWSRLTKDSRLDPLTGVMIYAAEPIDVHLPIATNNPEGNLTRQLVKGWNLASYASISSLTADEAFLADDLPWSYILEYDPVQQQYAEPIEKGRGSNERMVDPRRAYWVYMTEPGILVTRGL
ncbi:MAG TPA: PKD domain-containing protein [Methanospirillum sp.]|nr:PKD domain-containing protein [Methanospirillum sp.]